MSSSDPLDDCSIAITVESAPSDASSDNVSDNSSILSAASSDNSSNTAPPNPSFADQLQGIVDFLKDSMAFDIESENSAWKEVPSKDHPKIEETNSEKNHQFYCFIQRTGGDTFMFVRKLDLNKAKSSDAVYKLVLDPIASFIPYIQNWCNSKSTIKIDFSDSYWDNNGFHYTEGQGSSRDLKNFADVFPYFIQNQIAGTELEERFVPVEKKRNKWDVVAEFDPLCTDNQIAGYFFDDPDSDQAYFIDLTEPIPVIRKDETELDRPSRWHYHYESQVIPRRTKAQLKQKKRELKGEKKQLKMDKKKLDKVQLEERKNEIRKMKKDVKDEKKRLKRLRLQEKKRKFKFYVPKHRQWLGFDVRASKYKLCVYTEQVELKFTIRRSISNYLFVPFVLMVLALMKDNFKNWLFKGQVFLWKDFLLLLGIALLGKLVLELLGYGTVLLLHRHRFGRRVLKWCGVDKPSTTSIPVN